MCDLIHKSPKGTGIYPCGSTNPGVYHMFKKCVRLFMTAGFAQGPRNHFLILCCPGIFVFVLFFSTLCWLIRLKEILDRTSPSIKCVSFVIMHTLGAPTSRPTMSKYSTMTPQKHFKRRTPSLLRNLLMDVIAIYR